MNETEATTYLRGLTETVPDHLAPLGMLLEAGARTVRRRRAITASVVAGLVVVAGVGAAATALAPDDDGPGPDRAGPAEPNTTSLPDGTLTVGLDGVAVSVPGSWSVVDRDDPCAPLRLDRFVAGERLCRDGLVGQLDTSVVLAPLDSPDGRDVQGTLAETDAEPDELNGLAIRATGTTCVVSTGRSGHDRDCFGDIAATDLGVVVRVRAETSEAVDTIVASIRPLPVGYSVVPDLGDLARDLPPVPEVVDALDNVGFVAEGDPQAYVTRVAPSPGSVVPVGSEIDLITTPYRKGAPPPSEPERVDGTWAVQIVGVTDPNGPLPTMTLRTGEMSADDGCNRLGGSYTTAGRDLIFADSIESTTVDCDLTPALLDRLTRVRHLSFQAGGLYLHADSWEIILVLRRQ